MDFSKEKIEEIKKKHGGAYIIECDGKSALLRKPNRNDMSYALAVSNGGRDAIKMNEAFLNNLWVEGDEEIRTDDSYFFAASEQLGDIFEKRVASLKKL